MPVVAAFLCLLVATVLGQPANHGGAAAESGSSAGGSGGKCIGFMQLRAHAPSQPPLLLFGFSFSFRFFSGVSVSLLS